MKTDMIFNSVPETNKKMAEVEKSLSKNADDKERIERELIKKRDQVSIQNLGNLFDCSLIPIIMKSKQSKEQNNTLTCYKRVKTAIVEVFSCVMILQDNTESKQTN